MLAMYLAFIEPRRYKKRKKKENTFVKLNEIYMNTKRLTLVKLNEIYMNTKRLTLIGFEFMGFWEMMGVFKPLTFSFGEVLHMFLNP